VSVNASLRSVTMDALHAALGCDRAAQNTQHAAEVIACLCEAVLVDQEFGNRLLAIGRLNEDMGYLARAKHLDPASMEQIFTESVERFKQARK